MPRVGPLSSVSERDALRNLTEASGRVLLAVLFLLSGVGKLGAYKATVAYMASDWCSWCIAARGYRH